MKGSAGALLDTGENPTIAYGRGAAAARTLAAARAAPRTMDDSAETRLLRCARNDSSPRFVQGESAAPAGGKLAMTPT
jgi:hypothetical protein